MNLKKILFTLLAVTLILTSCNQSSDLSNAIPANANYIVHINTKSLIDKSKYDIFENTTVKQGINMYKVMLKDEAKVKLLDDFLKNSNSLGLNLKDDAYMFTDYKVFGFVIGVNNADKVKEALVGLASMSEEKVTKDGEFYLISTNGDGCVAWNNSKLIILGDVRKSYNSPGKDSLDIVQMSKDLLVQGADKSINSNKSYAEFSKNKKDFSVFVTMKGLDELESFGNYLPYGSSMSLNPLKKVFAKFQGVSNGMTVSFEKGEVVVDSKYYFDTPEAEKELKELVASMSGQIKGNHLGYLTTDPIMMFSMNVKGDGIYSYIKDLGFMEKLETESGEILTKEQLESLIKGCNGDITFALTSFKKNQSTESSDDEDSDVQIDRNTTPECFFMMDVEKPADVSDLIKKQIATNELKCNDLGDGKYSTQVGDNVTLYFGVNKNTFFITNIETVYKSINTASTNPKYADLIKGKSAVVCGNLNSIKDVLGNGPEMAVYKNMLSFLSDYELTMDSSTLSSTGKLQFTDKSDNSLALICKQVDAAISNLASMF